MKNRSLPLYILAASILLSALILAAALRTPAAPAETGDLEVIRAMVLERTVIPQDYFRGLDEDLAQQMQDYNSETLSLISQYTIYAKEQIHSLFEYYQTNEPERLNYFASEELICQAAASVAHCALYRNSNELLYNEPALAYIVSGEEGGSGSLWIGAIHQGFQVGDNLANQAAAYLDQVDGLLERLDGTP